MKSSVASLTLRLAFLLQLQHVAAADDGPFLDTFLRQASSLTGTDIIAYRPYWGAEVGKRRATPKRNEVTDKIVASRLVAPVISSILRVRPNTARIRVQTLSSDDFRIAAISSEVFCYSSPAPGSKPGDWRNRPRPAIPLVSDTVEEESLGQVGIRLFASAREIEGFEGRGDIDFCYAPLDLSVSELGVSRSFDVSSSTAVTDSKLVSLRESLEQLLPNMPSPVSITNEFIQYFDESRRGNQADAPESVAIRLSAVNFSDVPSSSEQLDIQSFIVNETWGFTNKTNENLELGIRVRTVADGIGRSQESHAFQVGLALPLDIEPPPPEPASNFDIIFAVTAAQAGVIIEEIVVRRLRPLPPHFRSIQGRTVLGLAVFALAAIDLLPLGFILANELQLASYVGYSMGVTTSTGRIGGSFVNDTLVPPSAFGLGVGAYLIHVTHAGARVSLVTTLLIAVIVVHISALVISQCTWTFDNRKRRGPTD